jgi:hypothetical protein
MGRPIGLRPGPVRAVPGWLRAVRVVRAREVVLDRAIGGGRSFGSQGPVSGRTVGALGKERIANLVAVRYESSAAGCAGPGRLCRGIVLRGATATAADGDALRTGGGFRR